LTWMSDSFFGQICSRVSGAIFHCDSRAFLRDRCTDDFGGVWPEMSVEGVNLVQESSQLC